MVYCCFTHIIYNQPKWLGIRQNWELNQSATLELDQPFDGDNIYHGEYVNKPTAHEQRFSEGYIRVSVGPKKPCIFFNWSIHFDLFGFRAGQRKRWIPDFSSLPAMSQQGDDNPPRTWWLGYESTRLPGMHALAGGLTRICGPGLHLPTLPQDEGSYSTDVHVG